MWSSSGSPATLPRHTAGSADPVDWDSLLPLSDNGTVSRSGSLRKSYVAEKVFFCPQKRARAAVSIAISYRLFYV